MLPRQRKAVVAPLGVTPLPPRLPERVRQLETAFSDTPKLATLNELISLYSVQFTQTAIEHYEALQNPLYRQYQEKLRTMLKQRDVTILLNQSAPSTPVHSPKSSGLQEPLSPVFRSKARRLATSAASQTFGDVREIDTMMQSSQSESNITVKKIQSDLRAQDHAVSSRLHIRKMNSPKGKDIRAKRFEFPTESSGPSTYEQELEKILEQHIRQKVEKQDAITRQYSEQIQELTAGGSSPIVARVIAEMQKAMEADLRAVELETEKSKRLAVDKLRQCFSPVIQEQF